MAVSTYPERTARLLRESGEREEATRRDGIRNASRCAWCQATLPAHDPRCLDAGR